LKNLPKDSPVAKEVLAKPPNARAVYVQKRAKDVYIRQCLFGEAPSATPAPSVSAKPTK
jgi:hypothetical protein